MMIFIANDVLRKEIVCSLKSDSITVKVRNDVLIQGTFYATIIPDECNWQLGLYLLNINVKNIFLML